MNKGSNITLIGGARLRRVSEDNKTLMDQGVHEGALVERDTLAKVVHIIQSGDKKKTAYVVEVLFEGKKLLGWVFSYEMAPASTLS